MEGEVRGWEGEGKGAEERRRGERRSEMIAGVYFMHCRHVYRIPYSCVTMAIITPCNHGNHIPHPHATMTTYVPSDHLTILALLSLTELPYSSSTCLHRMVFST